MACSENAGGTAGESRAVLGAYRRDMEAERKEHLAGWLNEHAYRPRPMNELTLTLPAPPSVNDRPSHPMEEHKAKNRYRQQCWFAALEQETPWLEPPEKVVMMARFYVRNKRDEDNLAASLKWPIDALKQKQTGKMRWRQGVAHLKGFFVDDDPAHLELLKPTQEIDRTEPRLEITLMWKDQ